MERLKDKISIITGAGRGIGKAIAEKFAKEGSKVIVTDIDMEACMKVAKFITEQKYIAVAKKMDTTNKEEVHNVMSEAIKEFGTLDILVNNAGTAEKYWTVDLPEDVWDKIIAVNLKGVFICSQAFLPTAISKGRGKIINIASIFGKTGNVLICHEAIRRCGFGAEIASVIYEKAFDYLDSPIKILGSKNTPIPFTPVLENFVIPDEEKIIQEIAYF